MSLYYPFGEGSFDVCRAWSGRVVAELGAGAVFGELALIDDSRRAATAVAIEETVCSTIDKHYILQKVKEADKVVQILFKLMLNIIRNYPK